MSRRLEVPERRLQRAVQYVSDLWFPVNPQLLSRLRQSIENKDYDNGIEGLIRDIQGDFSLFTFCLRELLDMLRKEGVHPPQTANPVELFRWGGLERLESILTLNDPPGLDHSFDSMSAAQRKRLEEAVVSASAAQVLARSSRIEPEVGFSSALLRQLGLTLIAWNYPSVYERALIEVKSGMNLDAAIAKILGFSPSILAITLAQKWGLHPTLTAAMAEPPEELGEQEEVEAIGELIARLCRIGEALARANDPEQYPSARQDWQLAKQEITARLGKDGLAMIQEAVAENCRSYSTAAANFFRPGTMLDPENAISVFERQRLISANVFVERCLPHVQRRLHLLYEILVRGGPAETSLAYLAREILPHASFSAGAIYTAEPSSQTLVPQLHFGAIKLRRLEPVAMEPATAAFDLISLAYYQDQPVVRFGTFGTEQHFSCLGGYFGFSQRIGVLYLEIPQAVYREAEDQHMIHFKAVVQALNACIGEG